jgi:hypothetical protein
MKIYTDKRLLAAGFVGGTLSRHSGNMREVSAQETVYRELGIPPERMLHFHQVHGDTLVPISSVKAAQLHAAKPLIDADAWLLSMPTGWGVAILTADCVPLFLWSEDGRCAALAHCGWRGVVQGLAGKTARALCQKVPAGTVHAWLGPHIQACCFEVQQDVAAQFSPDSICHRDGKLFVDLNLEIKHQLLQAGLSARRIYTPHYCTCGDQENFFSWRRDHQKNLLLSFIYKP